MEVVSGYYTYAPKYARKLWNLCRWTRGNHQWFDKLQNYASASNDLHPLLIFMTRAGSEQEPEGEHEADTRRRLLNRATESELKHSQLRNPDSARRRLSALSERFRRLREFQART